MNKLHWTVAGFTERELKEIEFARFYLEKFQHGTPGHSHLMLIARLSGLIDELVEESKVVANKAT